MKVCKCLQDRSLPTSGFYTKEVRVGGKRQGFDVVTMSGEESILSRIRDKTPAYKRGACPTVGQYLVDLESFDRAVEGTLQLKNEKQIFIVDEIGKMELLSQNFTRNVGKLFSSEFATVFGTIPIPKGKPLKLVEELRQRQDIQIFEVTKLNRDSLEDEVLESVLSSFGS